MNPQNKARELREQIKNFREQKELLMDKAQECGRAAEDLEAALREAETAEVWAYIGTEVDRWGVVVGLDCEDGFESESPLLTRTGGPTRVGYAAWPSNPTINGQRVTHFQPIRAEIEHRPDKESHPWLASVNGESIGFWPHKSLAIATLKNLAERIAPWWDGELVITERK